MTLERRDDKRIWKCNVCGEVNTWGPGWKSYGSVLDHEMIRQEDIPTVCSDECQDIFDRKMETGEIVVPKAKMRGYSCSIVGERKGY